MESVGECTATWMRVKVPSKANERGNNSLCVHLAALVVDFISEEVQ